MTERFVVFSSVREKTAVVELPASDKTLFQKSSNNVDFSISKLQSNLETLLKLHAEIVGSCENRSCEEKEEACCKIRKRQFR